ncbi:MAG: hypothetical protein ACK5II_14625 [Paracoccus sp. (in: a-proteobacteria)]
MIAAGFCGTLIGKTVLNRMDDKKFRQALDTVLILLSLRLIYSGLRTLLG